MSGMPRFMRGLRLLLWRISISYSVRNAPVYEGIETEGITLVLLTSIRSGMPRFMRGLRLTFRFLHFHYILLSGMPRFMRGLRQN